MLMEAKMYNDLLKKYNRIKYFKLFSAIMIDLVGIVSYVLPVVGEGGDLVWGPISGFLIYVLFPNHKRMAIGGALEEMLPFTDIIPTAYLTWRLDYVKHKNRTLSEFLKNRFEEEQIVNDQLGINDNKRIES